MLCGDFETSKPSPKSGGQKFNFHNFANVWTLDPSTLYQLPAPMMKTPGEDRPLSSLKVIPIITEKPVSVQAPPTHHLKVILVYRVGATPPYSCINFH